MQRNTDKTIKNQIVYWIGYMKNGGRKISKMMRYKGFAKDLDSTLKGWQIFAIVFSFIIVIIMLGLMISSVHGQLTDPKYIACIIMEMTGIQVVLETSESCPIELWTEAVKYYTSHGYVRTSYSNVFHPIITLTKEGE